MQNANYVKTKAAFVALAALGFRMHQRQMWQLVKGAACHTAEKKSNSEFEACSLKLIRFFAP